MRKASPSKSPAPAAKAQPSRARSSFARRVQSIAKDFPDRECPLLLPDNREWFESPTDDRELQSAQSDFLRTRADQGRQARANLPLPCAGVAAQPCCRCANAESPARGSHSSASEY